MKRSRFVVDTNTLISRLLLPRSIPAQSVQKAIQQGDLLFSGATLEELKRVLWRKKFDRYLEDGDRETFLRLLHPLMVLVEITHPVKLCRDPKDDQFLEVALNGQADALITGDSDLLDLNPFQKIPILTPRDFCGH